MSEVRSRWRTWIAVGALCAAFAWSIVAGDRGGPPIGAIAPTFTADVHSREARYHSTAAAGRTVVLDFWATWCPPCRKTLPVLQKLHRRYAETSDVDVLSVNTDDPMGRQQKIARFMAHFEHDFPVLLDDGAISAAYRVQAIPTLVIVGPDGRVRKVEVGAHDTPERMERHVIEAIEKARDGRS